MDPNETLRRLAEAINDMIDEPKLADEHFDEAVGILDDLGRWISKGGFAPKDRLVLRPKEVSDG